ncbi:DEP domain-containing mTOR-interacting protein [Seminavis robusta]|uniref:DEP domain-containing mTOR-interacting protein n=1 Tax=Seminavis robusta TaxID=568900 RepID=A0A9N8HFR2_9STRA|nr:DEP domain-containing mTOR-interacting protein [Seminavis robusta]|eukprot:Sro361_g126490.1 DEP domain-containing mTOR-interacting protein (1443) ;mRNA; f:25163-29753
MNSPDRTEQVKEIFKNLTAVETALQEVIQEHRHGRYGFLTREWGFTAPGGLGGRLGGKFIPWEEKLARCKKFFWPLEAYEAMEKHPFGKADPVVIKNLDLKPEGEQIYGNTPLHNFLREPPKQSVILDESADLDDYRSAARIFLLLGTLSHLYGNSAPDRSSHTLPPWIEEPLLVAAKRLQIEPTLSGHFLVQENWIWKSITTEDAYAKVSKASAKRLDRVIVRTLLEQCECADRRYRVKIYPDCFIGSQAIDVLIDSGVAETREEAVRVGRRINDEFKLFNHVTNDHPLIDKHLFYRFKKKWQQRKSEMATMEEVDIAEDPDESKNKDDNDNTEEDANQTPTSRLMRPSDIIKSFRASTTSVRSDSLVQGSLRNLMKKTRSKGRASSSGDSNTIDRGSNRSLSSVSDVASTTEEDNQPLQGNPYGDTPEGLVVGLTSTHLGAHDETWEMQEAMSIVAVMALVPVKDRRYRFRTYKQCFVACQMIDVLIEHECASTRKEAVELARGINERFGPIFEHVVDNHFIKDEYLFFRFTKEFKQMMQSKNGDEIQSVSHSGSTKHSSPKTRRSSFDSARKSTQEILDENLRSGFIAETSSIGSVDESIMALRGFDETNEFRIDNIDMLYPAFGHNHEKINQLIPACMGHAFASLPFDVLDIITTMKNILEAELSVSDISSVDGYESRRLYDLLYKVAFSVSRCKEEFQQMSTDPTSRTFNSKHISIKHTQPISNGVVVQGKRRKGTTGTQFAYFHLLDWLLGRHQYSGGGGLVAQIAEVDNTYTRPEREFIQSISKLEKPATLRGFLDVLGRPTQLLAAYNHLVECYAGEGGVLQAHCRKLYSYIHNDVQFSTSGTNHLKSKSEKNDSACPMSSMANNHNFATMMFKHMRKATDDRWTLRIPPLMTEVGKIVYSTSVSGGFTTVALDLSTSGLLYEYGDVVKIVLPNNDRNCFAWCTSLASNKKDFFTLSDMQAFHKDTGNGWGWTELWEALGWDSYEEGDGKGVPLELISRYVEQGQIRLESSTSRWVNNPLDLCDDSKNLFPVPPPLRLDQIASLEPVSPRVYSVSGVEIDRVFLLVSKPQDGARHHGYQAMCDPEIKNVHCSFSPATFFLVPPLDVNLMCIASGTGISPFVGLADAIGPRQGSYTIVHQCKSSDLFLANSQTWLDFTCENPGAVVMGYISGDRSRRNCPMRYIIRNGAFEETTVLRRHKACCYYFECSFFQGRIKETYKKGGLNLAYCCGGVKSAIDPLKNFSTKEGLSFQFTSECYAIPPNLTTDSTACQIAGTIVDIDQVGPIHPGGGAILEQLNEVCIETQDAKTPDLSVAFWELHPHAYNLHRCLRTPLDPDSKAFAKFLERQSMRNSVMTNMAAKYAEMALAAPHDSKVVRIATELQSSAIRQQLKSGDAQGAKVSAEYLEALLSHVPQEDQDANRWTASLEGLRKEKQ